MRGGSHLLLLREPKVKQHFMHGLLAYNERSIRPLLRAVTEKSIDSSATWAESVSICVRIIARVVVGDHTTKWAISIRDVVAHISVRLHCQWRL